MYELLNRNTFFICNTKRLGINPNLNTNILIRIKDYIKTILHLYTNRTFRPNWDKLSNHTVEKLVRNYYKNDVVTVLKEISSYSQQIFFISVKNNSNIQYFYLKCYCSHASWWTANSDNLFERDLSAMEILKHSNGLIPELIASGTKKNMPWILTRAIDGSPIDVSTPKLNSKKLATLVYNLQNTKIQNKLSKKLTRFDVNYVENEFTKIAKHCNIDLFFVEELITIIKKFSKTSSLVFSHGDLHTGNMILKPNNELAIIDFEDAIITYPQFDVHMLGSDLKACYGIKFYDEFLNHYYELLGYRFDNQFLEDANNFVKLRNTIMGIFLIRGGYSHKLPQYGAFIRNEKEARKDLTKYMAEKNRLF